ncbi:hypothetical protein KUTeg_009993, partial [Tegillarca granosa]
MPKGTCDTGYYINRQSSYLECYYKVICKPIDGVETGLANQLSKQPLPLTAFASFPGSGNTSVGVLLKNPEMEKDR